MIIMTGIGFAPPDYEGTSNVEELLSHNSSLKKVIQDGVFFYSNDKRVARDAREYYPDKRDYT